VSAYLMFTRDRANATGDCTVGTRGRPPTPWGPPPPKWALAADLPSGLFTGPHFVENARWILAVPHPAHRAASEWRPARSDRLRALGRLVRFWETTICTFSRV